VLRPSLCSRGWRPNAHRSRHRQRSRREHHRCLINLPPTARRTSRRSPGRAREPASGRPSVHGHHPRRRPADLRCWSVVVSLFALAFPLDQVERFQRAPGPDVTWILPGSHGPRRAPSPQKCRIGSPSRWRRLHGASGNPLRLGEVFPDCGVVRPRSRRDCPPPALASQVRPPGALRLTFATNGEAHRWLTCSRRCRLAVQQTPRTMGSDPGQRTRGLLLAKPAPARYVPRIAGEHEAGIASEFLPVREQLRSRMSSARCPQTPPWMT